MAEDTPKSVPKRIKAYQVSGLLGSGGMGDVYRATHDLLDRAVAIKRYAPKPGSAKDDKDNRERFLREGKALAKLQHHGIVGVHDLFEHRGNLYMVMEYVNGFHLGQLLTRGPLPLDVACIIGLKVAEALEHAHFHRIIHRDIKTTNVMVSREGQVKLMDFGIARGEVLDIVTQTGLLVGTPIYLAPEVIEGKPASELSDIYAWGALMYACLSGRKLFENVTQKSLYPKILAGKYESLKKVAKGTPRQLRFIVKKCLARDPKDRIQSAAELRQSLDLFMASQRIWMNHSERLIGHLYTEDYLDEDSHPWFEVSDFMVQPAVPKQSTGKLLLWIIMILLLVGQGAAIIWAMHRLGWLSSMLEAAGISH